MTKNSQWRSFAPVLACVVCWTGCNADPASQDPVGQTTETSGSSDGTSTGDTEDSGVVEPAVQCDDPAPDSGGGVLRRLSKLEYQLTLQDLFLLPTAPAVELIPEDIAQEGFTAFTEAQSVTAAHLRAYWDTAAQLFDELAQDETRKDQVLGCSVETPNCLSDFIGEFGRLVYRRDLTSEEVTSLVGDAQEFGVDANDQFRYAVEALLISPEFLFRLELGDAPEGLSNLNAFEVASRLSFTLWGRGPSAALLDQAAAGALDTSEGLSQVALQMLDDPKTQEYYRHFFRQWLGYTELRKPLDPPADWTEALLPQMQEETDALVAEYAWGAEQPFFDALTANHTTVSPGLAAFYGVTADATGHVEYSSDDPRTGAGLLGHASLMSQKTDGDKISVRGNWLRRTFLCKQLEIPPGLAEVLGEQLVGLTSTEIIAERNEEASCKKCHSQIDPIGVGLAYFDAAGRYDSSVDLASYPIAPGFPDAEDPSLGSLAELSSKLEQMPETAACLSERVFLYMHGRDPSTEDTCTHSAASQAFLSEGERFSTLLRDLVLAPSFRTRRAPTVSP